MKNRLSALMVLCIATMLISCEKKSAEPPDQSKNSPLKGKIAGGDFEFKQGNAVMNFTDDNKMLISLYPILLEDSCATGQETDNVIFVIKPVLGKFNLVLDWNDWEKSLTVTLFDFETFFNQICVDGYVELTRLDEINGVVEGNLNAGFGDDYQVEGSFQVPICNDFTF